MTKKKKDEKSTEVVSTPVDFLDTPPKTKRPVTRGRSKKKEASKEATKSQTVHLQVGDDTESKEPQSVTIQSGSPGSSSPYHERFQLDLYRSPQKPSVRYERIASQTARIAGLFFVVAGAISTLFNMQYLSGSSVTSLDQPLASVSDTCIDGISAAGTICTSTSTGTNGGSGSGSPSGSDVEPDVNIAIDTPGSGNLYGTIPVYITVPNATAVSVYAYYKTGEQLVTLGTASHTSSASTWIYYWRTTEHDDGEYKLKVLVTNSYGTYDEVDSVYRVVENDPVTDGTETTPPGGSGEDTSSSTASSSTDTTLEEEGEPEENTVSIRPFESTQLRGTARVTISAFEADTVKVYLKSTNTDTNRFLGYAYESNEDTGEWIYSMNTGAFADGSYTLRAAGIFDGTAIQSESLAISIRNTEGTTVTATTTVSPTQTPATEPTTTATTLAPKVALTVRQSGVLSESVDVRVDVSGAHFVELYAVPQYALTQIFLGLAQKIDSDRWNFKWNTRQIPNGSYRLFSKVKNSYGLYESDRVLVSVYNTVETEEDESVGPATDTATTPTRYEDLKTLSTTVEPIVAEQKGSLYLTTPETTEKEAEEREEVKDAEEEEIDNTETTTETSEEPAPPESQEDRLDELLAEYRERIDEEIKRLSSAIRSGDDTAIRRAKERLTELRDKIRKSLPDNTEEESLIASLDERINTLFARIEETTEKTETIVKERVGDVITKDSDSDGITDYDEINIYGTDPASADSDQDGFIDGTEILNGYDPKDSTPEAAVAFESPKDVGVVREDILKVEAVAAFEVLPDETPKTKAPAVITGKALPNSFVTLYIFSTPIIVTVKTESDGSWSYMFDKELDDGEHEVYVGMTDNTGRIIAKSSPFRFVKTAEAFSPVGTDGIVPATTGSINEPSFMSEYMVLVVLSIAVVAIGLVLMMLGFHMESRKKVLPDTTTNADIAPQVT